MRINNPLLLIDGYKADHRRQYPNGTTLVYSNLTPRKSRIEGLNFAVHFGLQYFCKEYLQNRFNAGFFSRPKQEVLDEYDRRMKGYLGFSIPLDHIADLHDLGYLPIQIDSVPEGTKVPIRVPMLTIHNTHPNFGWLTNQLETIMSTTMWQGCTSAAIAHLYRKAFDASAERTGYDAGFIDFQGHDFSFRGMSSLESAMISGAAHLLSFKGSDTIPAIDFVEQFYEPNGSEGLIAASVSASEHSVATLNIAEIGGSLRDAERASLHRLITEVYPSGIFSYVADSYDFWGVITDIVPSLKKEIMGRDGSVVCRPDCYDDQTEIMTSAGWKFFRDLTNDDLVAQVVDNNEIEYIKPTKIVDQEYSGKMIRFSSLKNKVDLLVTPNHRLVWYKNNSKESIEEAESSTVGVHYKKMRRSASNKNFGKKLLPIERFLIAFQADGSFPSNYHKITENQCGYIQARFTFTKQRKIDRLSNICEEAGLEYSVHTEKSRDFQKVIYVKIPLSTTLLKDFSWVESNNSKLCSNWCREFVEESSYWDATRRNDNRFKFDTTNKKVVDVMYNIATVAGYGVKYTITPDDRKEHFSDIHTLHIMKNNLIGGQAFIKSEEDYNGRVYCVQVPSGKILVRRNNISVVCGNSGDPVKIICGDPDAVVDSPEYKGAYECLWETFGGTVNSKGYKELDSHIGLIYGDSITLGRQAEIIERLESKGFAPKVVLGIGSFSYQMNTRDTLGFAVKATYGEVNGKQLNIYKEPKTGDGEKKSAKGWLHITNNNGTMVLADQQEPHSTPERSSLNAVFKDGELLWEESFHQIRERLNAPTN